MNVVGIALDELYRVFDILNKEYYEGKLEVPVLTIQRAKRASAGAINLGWFTLDKVWKDKVKPEDGAKYEINISAEMLNYDVNRIVETLHHECVHYMNKVNGVRDCNAQVHNKKFKTLAESVGLVCEKSKKYGWGFTSCSDEFTEFINTTIKPNPECFEYFRSSVAVAKPAQPNKKRTFKYVCPTCKLVAKAPANSKIRCESCNVLLEVEDEN